VAVWEVFRQEREGAPFQHGGALEAPDRAFAEAYAREFYGRRNESVALWVVPREAILDIDDPNLDAVFERDYRRVDGYSIKVKLREARERAGTARAGHAPPLQPAGTATVGAGHAGPAEDR
jgi:phenylacetate-CoA oxygenase PaaH subunit